MYPHYMCILPYVLANWCNGISEIYCQLEWGIYVSSVYVHSVIYATYLVSHYSIGVLSIGVLGVYVS